VIDIIKSHPWTFAVSMLISLVAIAGVIYGVITKGRWKDYGLMVRNGYKLHINPAELPILVFMHSNVPNWIAVLFNQVREELNNKVGFVMMGKADVILVQGLDLDKLPKGHLGVVMGEDEKHGQTYHRYDKRTGEILSTKITLPPLEPLGNRDLLMKVIMHEVGHVFGLAHDERRDSIMHPSIQHRAQAFTEGDINLLRETYNKRGEHAWKA